MFIDASDVITANEVSLTASKLAIQNVQMVHACTNILRAACMLEDFNGPDDITVLRLAIRLINAAGAGGQAALAGYYQPAVAQVRDIVEVGFLLDVFQRDRAQINRWRVCGHDAMRKNFSPYKLRGILDKLDGLTEGRRTAAYEFYTQHGTHADPENVGTISIDGDTKIGPFPDADRVVAITFDFAMYLALATSHVMSIVDVKRIANPEDRLGFTRAKLQFATTLAGWSAKLPKSGDA